MRLQWFRANGLGLDSSRGAEFHRVVVAGGQRLRVAAASCIAFAATFPAFRRHGHPTGRGTGFRPPNRPEDCALLDNIVKNAGLYRLSAARRAAEAHSVAINACITVCDLISDRALAMYAGTTPPTEWPTRADRSTHETSAKLPSWHVE